MRLIPWRPKTLSISRLVASIPATRFLSLSSSRSSAGIAVFVGSAAGISGGPAAVDRVPWRQLHDEARAMAVALQARGVGPGTRRLRPGIIRTDMTAGVAAAAGLTPVTTEKDAVRLPAAHPAWVVALELELLTGAQHLSPLLFARVQGPL